LLSRSQSLSALLSRESGAVAQMPRVSQTVTDDNNIVIGTSSGSVSIAEAKW